MARVGGVISVDNTSRGWEVKMTGPYHTVTRVLGTRSAAVDYAYEQKISQERREAEQSGLSSVYEISIEGAAVVTSEVLAEMKQAEAELKEAEALALSEAEALLVEPEKEPQTLTEFLKSEGEPAGADPEPEASAEDIEVVSVGFDDDKVQIKLKNNTESKLTVWRSIDGKEGTRALPKGKVSHWSYKGTADSAIVLRQDDEKGFLLYTSS